VKLIDLTPGVKVNVPTAAGGNTVRTVEKVIVTHPVGPMVRFYGTPWMRHYYSFAQLKRDGAEVAS
jgi:hypothetical protein